MDGSLLLQRGMDSGRSPALIQSDQLSMATNLTVRGGFAVARPPFVKAPIQWPTGVQALNFQGFSFYNGTGNSPTLAMSAGGRQFLINPISGLVKEITIDTESPPTQPVTWMLQAERFLIIQDGLSAPFFFDGGTAWRGNASGIGNPNNNPSIPTGTTMAYVQGRIWVASQQQYMGGDIVFNQESGTAQYNYADSILYNTENQFLNGGGSFSVPSGGGSITSMQALPTIDTSTGQGPMAVFTSTMVFSNDVPTDRTQWQNLTYPAQVVAQLNFGSISEFATVSVNGDLFYRSIQGIQSFKVANRRFSDAWGNVPLSREVQRILKNDNVELLPYASAVFFDNRFLLTCAPQWIPATSSVVFPGLIALDFDVLSAMDQLWAPANRVPPAYDGLWTGLNWMRLITGVWNGVTHCFGVVLNSDGLMEIWEILPTETSFTQDNDSNPITWTFETKSYDFQNPATLKECIQIETWLEKIIGPISIQWQWRPDKDPNWYTWGPSKNFCQNQTLCPIVGCVPPMSMQPGWKPRVRVAMPENVGCDTPVQQPNNLGYRFQYRAVITGYCRIAEMRFSTYQREDDPNGTCDSDDTCYSNAVCQVNNFAYQIPD